MSPTLPDAEAQTPACGCCYGSTDYDDGDFVCQDCQLAYDSTMTASYLDPDAEPCGKPCTNTSHTDGERLVWTCHPCQLPTTHAIGGHWTGCELHIQPRTGPSAA
ncbi:MAG: hypothetical protein IPJ61_17685 [Tessaracoccus sp.]|uniref:hypothetical protein n=1 Tax=Tessaracoccus sp. TaxID=1971211 RepID=UPI001ED45E92|nr:hypothetical protein [Tessaracoccus sp.]MBK7822836.1 hypothetical protein [Tessaracoccus sp.]